ncbi:MAG: hypothetical protein ACTSVV_03985 [Promethearchaeota archaeon]
MSDLENFLDEPPKKSRLDGFLANISVRTESAMRELLLVRPYSGLFKDLEITKGQFITLFLILLSFASVLTVDIFLNIDFSRIENRPEIFESEAGIIPIPSSMIIVVGVVLGFIIGGFLLDQIRGRRYPILLKLLSISIIITLWHILFFRWTGYVVPKILFFGNSFIAGMICIFFLLFFIDFTTILERGRVFSYLILLLGISVGVGVILINLYDVFMFLPVIVLILALLYFYKNKEREEPYKPIEIEVERKKKLNYDVIKYCILLSLYGMIIGLMTPAADLQALSTANLETKRIIFYIFIILLTSFTTAVGVGMVFDFYGRKSSLASIILAISIVNFVKLFQIKIPYFELLILFAAFVACFMSVPLLISEVASRQNLGKVLGIAFTLTISCVIVGIILGYTIIHEMLSLFTSKYTLDIFLISIINFAAILSLFILVNIKDMISSKEQNWPDKLVHLYVIHESGVLLYEHSFIEEDLAEADLISGGFIGLIALLQEITKEKQRLKSIDHGGKRILFGFNSDKSIIFALVVTEELIILRNKLFYFIQEVEEKYADKLRDFTGVDSNLWKNRIEPIMERHFKRKYFELIPEFILNNIEINKDSKE